MLAMTRHAPLVDQAGQAEEEAGDVEVEYVFDATVVLVCVLVKGRGEAFDGSGNERLVVEEHARRHP
jgi:hypothetical protein